MGKEEYLIISIFLIGMTTAQSINTECTTPKNEKGVCINYHYCPILLALLNQTNDPSNKNLLKESFCGYIDKQVQLCCPLETKSPSLTTCGISGISDYVDRIIGGQPAKLGAWPWMAALGYRHSDQRKSLLWLCGGTLVSSKHVLTATHCVRHSISNSYLSVVRLGELDLDDTVDDGAKPLDFEVYRTIPHPKYGEYDYTNDITLLQLKSSVTFTDYIKPICLPNTSFMRNRKMSSMPIVAGWGYTFAATSERKVEPNNNTVLMEVEISIASTAECKKKYSKTNKYPVIDSKVICAGLKDGKKDSCWGDSGGPLMLKDEDQYFLIGIVSYGPTICGTPGLPGVYTNVSSFADWVHQKIIL